MRGIRLSLFLFALLVTAVALPPGWAAPYGWAGTVKPWAAFAKAYENRMAYGSDRPRDPTWREVTHPLLKKYLPDYRVFANGTHTAALYKSGQITILENPRYPIDLRRLGARVSTYSEFMRQVGLPPLHNERTAIDVANLAEILWSGCLANSSYSAPGDIYYGTGWGDNQRRPRAKRVREAWMVGNVYISRDLNYGGDGLKLLLDDSARLRGVRLLKGYDPDVENSPWPPGEVQELPWW